MLSLGLLALLGGPAPGLCRGGAGVEALARELRSDIASVRESAAVWLGRLGDASAVPALVAALEDREAAVRREAARALGALKDNRAVPALIKALRDRDRTVRFYAAYALGEIQDPRAADALLAALRDPAWCVRDQAAWALRALGDPAVAEPLAAALKQPDADVAHIVWLLCHLDGEHAVGPLGSLLESPETNARLRAVRALARLGQARAVPPLVAALEDEAPEMRRAAVEALRELRDDRALKPLQALAARELVPSVREAAEQAVRQLSRHEALVAHWSFDDGDAEVAHDASGRGIDGQVRGATPVDGKAGKALDFRDGAHVELGKPAALPVANTPLTIMAWAKPRARDGVVVARGGAFCGFSLYVKDGRPKFGIHRVQDGPAHIAAAAEPVGEDWVHLAGVVKSNRLELFVNGRLAATAKTPGFLPGNCGQGMQIGFDAGNSAAEITDAFQGILDEVKVFHAALSAREIARQAGLETETP